jgi:hypothetical protein
VLLVGQTVTFLVLGKGHLDISFCLRKLVLDQIVLCLQMCSGLLRNVLKDSLCFNKCNHIRGTRDVTQDIPDLQP